MVFSGFTLYFEITIKVNVLKIQEDPIIYNHEANIQNSCVTHIFATK